MVTTILRRRAILTVVATLASCSQHVWPLKPTAGERVAARLKDVERMELFAIDPRDRQRSTWPTTQSAALDRFDGYRVLARATVEDKPEIRGLVDSIRAAVSDPTAGIAKACAFVPHHAVRFTLKDGVTVDFIACFTCGDAYLSDDGFWIDRGAVADFDASFARNGLSVPVAE